MDIGDIYEVEIPPSDGHEQAGTRPAIIVQATQFEKRLPTVIIVPFTSQLKAQTFPGTYIVHRDSENNLATDSVALIFQLRAIDKRRLKNRVGKLSRKDLAEIEKQLKNLLNI